MIKARIRKDCITKGDGGRVFDFMNGKKIMGTIHITENGVFFIWSVERSVWLSAGQFEVTQSCVGTHIIIKERK